MVHFLLPLKGKHRFVLIFADVIRKSDGLSKNNDVITKVRVEFDSCDPPFILSNNKNHIHTHSVVFIVWECFRCENYFYESSLTAWLISPSNIKS